MKQEGSVPAGGSDNKEQAQKSKAELKAERRAKQEAQRAAKAARNEGGKPRPDSAGMSKTLHLLEF